MSTLLLPNTDLKVSALCMGTGGIGSDLDREASFALLDQFVAAGGNFLDTASVYGDWVPGIERSASEKVIGAWLHERRNRDTIVIGTKGAHPYLDSVGVSRLSPQEITHDLDASLRNLQTDRIDLYWLHRDDPNVPVEPIIETLESAVRDGKIRYYGASNWRVPRLESAQEYAHSHGYQGFVADQILWNVGVLKGYPVGDTTLGWMDEERVFCHERTGMATLAFQSQAGGLFHRMAAGKLTLEKNPVLGSYRLPECERRLARMQQLMEETGLSLTQVVLGYLRGQPVPTIPIIGSHTPAQLSDSMSALDVVLSPEQILFIAHG